jgi:hypothetical protein
MYDLRIEYPDGERAAVEVTTAADEASLALWRALEPLGRWRESDLVGGWAVAVERTADARRLRRELPPFLKRLEALGVRRLEHRYPPDALDAHARALGVAHAWQSPDTSFAGSIYVTIELPFEQMGGAVADSSDAVARWIGPFLHDEKRRRVLQKLARLDVRERHAFVVVLGFGDVDFSVSDPLSRDDVPVPTVDPALPEEVTDVWIASTWSAGSGFRWSRSPGWSAFAKV